jgi:WD40 repeat protein
LVLDGAILPDADLSGKDFSNTSLQYANLDNVNFTNSNFCNCNLTDVRIEETAPVQGIAVSPDENILALYHDGIIREWQYQRLQRPHSTNLDTGPGISGKDLKMIAQPGNDLSILDDRYLYFYDREGEKLKLKATIEVNPGIRLIKASPEYLLLNEVKGRQNRLILVDLNEPAIVKSFPCSSFTLCDHLDRQALVICNEKEELHVRDISGEKRAALVIPAQGKISCLATCKCSRLPGGYLLGLGLYNGAVQIWQIQVDRWNREKLLEQPLHEQGKPIKDLSFIDEGRIVSGSLDKTIKLLTFSPEGKPAGDVKEFKMTLQCRGMKIDGVTREKIEGKKLGELIDKAAQVQ